MENAPNKMQNDAKSLTRYWTVSEIVNAEYCEQKALFDQEHGDNPSQQIKDRRDAGIHDHNHFEARGEEIISEDRRCFVATAIYGENAEQTQFLREWRDKRLLSCSWGRSFVKVYYFLSPALLVVVEPIPYKSQVLGYVLDRIIARIKASSCMN